MVDTGLSLKCDLHECLLDPVHLPYQFNYVSVIYKSPVHYRRFSISQQYCNSDLSKFMIPRLELKRAVFMKNCHCVRESEMLYRIIMNNSLLQFKICEPHFKSQTHSKPSKYAVLNILVLDFNTFIVRNTA